MNPETPSLSLIPFVLGVSGHRDLRPQDYGLLREEVRKVFEGLRARMPNTPLLLLSALAEGADQLAAEVALEQGVALIAVLPMPLESYKAQMSADAARKFDQLLSSSVQTILLPQQGRSIEEIQGSEALRASAYEALGEFLIRHVQALLALWDGTNSMKRGGTSSVVHRARTRTPEETGEGTEVSCGVVYHVVTPRLRSKEPVPAIRTLSIKCDGDEVTRIQGWQKGKRKESNLAKFEISVDRFNRDALRVSDEDALTRPLLSNDPELTLSSFQRRLQALYMGANAISLRASRMRKRVLLGIIILAVTGTLCYGVHGEIFDAKEGLWWLTFPLFVIAAIGLYWYARARHVEDNYLDARALAEALRVQFFWDLAGINLSTDQYYLLDRRTKLDWIRVALRNILLLRGDRNGLPSDKPKHEAVLRNWVRDQEEWYRARAERQMQSVERREHVSHIALFMAILWSILVPFSIFIYEKYKLAAWRDLDSHPRLLASFHIALAFPALLAAAYKFWIEQSGYEEQSREYRYMNRQFSLKAKEIEAHIDSPAAVETLLLDLGIEALKENGRWLLLHRERPLEVLSSP